VVLQEEGIQFSPQDCWGLQEEDEEFAMMISPVTMTSKIMIAGVENETRATKKTISDTAVQVLYRKGDRDALSMDARHILFKSAAQTVPKKYNVMPLSLHDKDKLDDAYVLIQRTKQEHFKYDMHDIFAARSLDKTSNWLKYKFFQNNVSEKLVMKISKTYEMFKASEQEGGPSFFIWMMNHLLSETEKAAQ
jgi:hypothetical protein